MAAGRDVAMPCDAGFVGQVHPDATPAVLCGGATGPSTIETSRVPRSSRVPRRELAARDAPRSDVHNGRV